MAQYGMKTGLLAAFMFLVSTAGLSAAELKQETLRAWDRYIAANTSQVPARVQSNETFLQSVKVPEFMGRLRAGEIVVAPMGRTPAPVPGGMIHHWIGAVFMPDTTVDDVFAVVRDYARYKCYYAPLVVDSKPLGHFGEEYRFSMLMMNQSLFSRSALDGEYAESYFRVTNTRWYSIANSTRVQQIDDFGRQGEHRLPTDEGSGYIWRLCSISRFEQRDGGVYVELEVIALSRDIPVAVRWFVGPIVRRVARGSLETSLERTRAAVSTQTATILRRGDRTHALLTYGAEGYAGGR